MNKEKLKKALGGTCGTAAKKLGYAHRQSVQDFSDPLTAGEVKTVTRRLMAMRWSKARIAELD